MRGLYSATVLETLARHFSTQRQVGPLDIGKGFDLVVGTSTGGILACSLAFGLPLSKLADLYRVEGPKIFTDPMPDTSETLKLACWLWRNRKKAANSNAHLQATLHGFFGTETLRELYRRRGIGLCIPAVKAEPQTTVVFKTPHLPRFTRDGEYRLIDVCLATSAAPIFLPMVNIPSPTDASQAFIYADGGLWANNPTLVGILEALEIIGKQRRPIEVLSIGTCAAPEGEIISSGNENWGFLQWRAGTKVVSLSLNAQAAGTDYMASLLRDRLRDLGYPISLIRLRSGALNADQMRVMRLDAAGPDALRVLGQAGVSDGEAVIRQIDGGGAIADEAANMIKPIFNDMPPIQT